LGILAFFFSSRRRHTRFSRDWSQTCALPIFADPTESGDERGLGVACARSADRRPARSVPPPKDAAAGLDATARCEPQLDRLDPEIGRASCREREQVLGG